MLSLSDQRHERSLFLGSPRFALPETYRSLMYVSPGRVEHTNWTDVQDGILKRTRPRVARIREGACRICRGRGGPLPTWGLHYHSRARSFSFRPRR